MSFTTAKVVKDPYGLWAIVKCVRGGWALWRYSSVRRAWIGDPPAKGPFKTRREALAEAKARAEEAFAWKRLSDERERESRAWISQEG